jgi:hypothetical protein
MKVAFFSLPPLPKPVGLCGSRAGFATLRPERLGAFICTAASTAAAAAAAVRRGVRSGECSGLPEGREERVERAERTERTERAESEKREVGAAAAVDAEAEAVALLVDSRRFRDEAVDADVAAEVAAAEAGAEAPFLADRVRRKEEVEADVEAELDVDEEDEEAAEEAEEEEGPCRLSCPACLSHNRHTIPTRYLQPHFFVRSFDCAAARAAIARAESRASTPLR